MESAGPRDAAREHSRLDALAAYRVLDTPPEDDFDRLVRLAVGIFNVPVALIALADQSRLFLKARAGLSVSELPYLREPGRGLFDVDDVLLVQDLAERADLDIRPLAGLDLDVRFCAATPLHSPEGSRLGVFCLLDTRRRDDFDVNRLEMLHELGRLTIERLEVRRLDAARRISRVRLESIARGSPDAIVSCDDVGRVVFWNSGAHRLFGLSEAQALGCEFAELLEPPSRAVFRDQLQALQHLDPGAPVYAPDKLMVVPRPSGSLLLEVAISRWYEGGTAMHSLIMRDVSQRQRRESRLLGVANFDALTELPNATMFRGALTGLVSAHRRFALVLVGLESMRAINAERGPRVGDTVLRAVSHRLRLLFPDNAILSRLAGAEFGVALQGDSEPERLAVLCRQLFDSLAVPMVVDGVQLELGCCAGVALHPHDGLTVEDLMDSADLALYEARREGVGTCRFFVPPLREAVLRRKKLGEELRLASESGEFELFYQPLVDLGSGTVVGAEALLRWHHPVAGLVPPADFIHVLETLPVIGQMGRWILATACRQAVAWRKLCPGFRMSVNLFATQLLHESIDEVVLQTLEQTGLPAAALELEITENTLLKPNPRLLSALRALCDAGVGVAFDDYGTGYASLSLLKSLPLTRLKIDRSFVANVPADVEDAAVIQAILYLGERFDLEVIAEGIENEDQVRFLRAHGCALGQGFHFGRPMPARDFLARSLLSRTSPSAS